MNYSRFLSSTKSYLPEFFFAGTIVDILTERENAMTDYSIFFYILFGVIIVVALSAMIRGKKR